MFHIRHVNPYTSENYPLAMRRHQGLYEFYMFLFCYSPLNLILKNGEKVYCEPGSFIIFSPYEQQYWDALPPRFVHGFLSFTIDDPKYFETLELITDYPINPRMNKEIANHLMEISNELYENNEIGKQYQIDRLINGLFLDISRKMHNAAGKNIYEKDLLKTFEDIRLLMFEDPSKKIDYFASQTGFSTRRFQQHYKHFFEVIPSSDLNVAKLTRAKECLKNGEAISTIAEKIGFSSAEYFVRWFTKNTGISPKDFNKN